MNKKTIKIKFFKKFSWYFLYVLLFPISAGFIIKRKIILMDSKISEIVNKINEELILYSITLSEIIKLANVIQWKEKIINYIFKINNTNISILNIDDKVKINDKLDLLKKQIYIEIEKKLNFKSVEKISDLKNKIKLVEKNIILLTKKYNYNISLFNNYIHWYPQRIIASKMEIISKDSFETTNFNKQNILMDYSKVI